MLYTGIDLHKRTTVLATVDEAGRVVREASVPNSRSAVARYFAKLPAASLATVEATSCWYWLRDLLEREGVPLTLAHAKFVKAIAHAKVKTDAVDALTAGATAPGRWCSRRWADGELARNKFETLAQHKTRSDSESVVGPQDIEEVARPPLSSLPPSDGADPAVISYTVGETRVDSFTFDAPDAYEINGNPWGVWFGTNEIVDDPPTPTGNDYWSMGWSHAHDWKSNSYSRLYFIPPVRRFSFTHATGLNQGLGSQGDEPPPDAFGYYVLDTAFHYVIQDSIRANGCPGLCVGATAQNNFTTRIDVSTGDEDRIHHVLFKGYMNIDDLVIVRAGPALLECGESVVRGTTATCTVDSSAEEVFDWKFTSTAPFGLNTAESASTSHIWSGKAVLTGVVSVTAIIADDTISLADSLIVTKRQGDEWSFGSDPNDWHLAQDTTPTICNFDPFVYDGSTDVNLGFNRPRDAVDCDENFMFTPKVNSPASAAQGITGVPVTDGGPNDGLWYVGSAQYHMYRATEITPWLKSHSGSVPGPYHIATTAKKDKNACREIDADTLGNKDTLWVTTYRFNEACEQNNLDDLLAAIQLHEGFGTVQGANANGHESRNRYAAQQPPNDPHALAEGLAAMSQDSLNNLAFLKLGVADQNVRIYGADSLHVNVTGNWSNPRDVYRYSTVQDRFYALPISPTP